MTERDIDNAVEAVGAESRGETYSKDYWDLVFDQLGKRRLFKLAVAILAVVYATAIRSLGRSLPHGRASNTKNLGGPRIRLIKHSKPNC